MTRQYLVIYEWGGRNFSGYAPDVPGCIATARTLSGMRVQLRGALEAYLHGLRDANETIPDASAEVTVDMAQDPEFPNPPGYYVVVEHLEVTLPRKKRATTRKTTIRKTAMRELTAA